MGAVAADHNCNGNAYFTVRNIKTVADAYDAIQVGRSADLRCLSVMESCIPLQKASSAAALSCMLRPKPNAMEGPFDIGHVVAVASKHPFYSAHEYPLRPEEVAEITTQEPVSSNVNDLLSRCPIIQKEDLYREIPRLFADNNPQNTFRHSTYISVTGGGGGESHSLSFLTDIKENRAQRKACGELLRRLNVLKVDDCVVSMHATGKLYRALDLTIDIIEHAGASVLPVGHISEPEEVVAVCLRYGATTISGDTSQIIRLASFVESSKTGSDLRISKILYTSESMSRLQRTYIKSVFSYGESPIAFSSLLGSAEMGPWAVGCFELTGPQEDDTADFIFDTRNMIVEVMPLGFDLSTKNCPCRLVEGEAGVLIVTSLQRLRNPLVRYATGDIGSIHPLQPSASSHLGQDAEHLRVLRLHGRDIRSSFNWQGEYFELDKLRKLMSTPAWGIMRWQIVLTSDPSNLEHIEIRLMRATGMDGLLGQDAIEEKLKEYFWVASPIESLFHVNLRAPDDFIRSSTGNKVIQLVDRRGQEE
ncbi:hypothetical protein V490_07472 [Pseudogymnoascus sp. VKM F-3557]|nr:hypothetical protein V490_07472 [Pseudogymnoascus sp. VKM F-3557]